jgi:ubiquitin-like 1-activating enzyme E1 A
VQVTSGGSLAGLLAQSQQFYAPFDCIIACDHGFDHLSMINTAARLAQRPFYAAGIHGFYGYIFADLVNHEYVVEREKSNVATPIGPESATRGVLSVTTKKDNDGKNKEIVKKQEIYCPLILANSSPLPPDVLSSRRKLKAVPALLPCLRALFDFQRTYGRAPGHSSADLAAFTQSATMKSKELQLPPETLKAEFLRSFLQSIDAELPPVAGFVGGRLSEDVINVIGKREQPIQNFVLFDGDALEGRIYSLFTPPPELQAHNGLMPTHQSMNGVDLGMMGGDATLMNGVMVGDLGATGMDLSAGLAGQDATIAPPGSNANLIDLTE